ncbi:hypothetical protein RHMOL_Rhmol08G0018500 [Rhododendron molle]|uniref:Uncharacterized protein n=1 Tax=Rhododendron molle TaxID=49168 RepID=A0ACC0MJD3_RHOML|nr:hypothetical protein RHMOL_Rhmol08G0018500 [Rhododendron molle]
MSHRGFYDLGSHDPQAEPFTSQEIEENIRTHDEEVGWVTQRVEVDIDQRANERVEAKFEQLKAQMLENMDSRGSEVYRPVLDAASGHQTVTESIEDDNAALEQSHRTPPLSSIPDRQTSKARSEHLKVSTEKVNGTKIC